MGIIALAFLAYAKADTILYIYGIGGLTKTARLLRLLLIVVIHRRAEGGSNPRSIVAETAAPAPASYYVNLAPLAIAGVGERFCVLMN